MLQAPMFECLSLDPFSSFDDGRSPAEVGIGRCHIVEALVVSAVVVMLDEGLDLLVEITAQVFHLVRGRSAGRVTGEATLASLHELFGLSVIQALGDTLAAAKLGNGVIAS